MPTSTRPVALITGASKGIGRAVAIALAEDRFDLVLCARSLDGLNEAKSEIGAKSPQSKIEVHSLDVRDDAAVSNMVASTLKTFGRIDLLFNNAGIFTAGTSMISLEDFSNMLDINLRATFHFVSLVAPIMKEQKSGRIINLSSRAGKIARAGAGGYSASKFGLIGFNESLYKELSELGIRVTALCPGFVDTEMAGFSGLDSAQMLSTEDIVKTVRWLLSLSPAACVKEVFLEPVAQVG